jgi:hypothetical protein
MFLLPEDDIEGLKKRNRAKKLAPKKHKIVHESGRSTKSLWAQILAGAKSRSK